MNFFKSVFTDPDPPSDDDNDNDDVTTKDIDVTTTANTASTATSSGWDFGGLMKTLATKSETVIQTYRRDLEEFGAGLKSETAAIRAVAAKAVGDLPSSLEAGASAAQESLESVGQAIDEFGGSVWRGTTDIIAPILNIDSDSNSEPGSALGNTAKRYTRFEAQVLAVQNDARTFSEEPEDAEDFRKWREGFEVGEREEEIEVLCYENSVVEGFVEKFVPGVVDYETFWARYYYRVWKLKQVEDARAKLVKRVIDREEEEDLSWDVDDDDDVVVVDDAKKGEKNLESSGEKSAEISGEKNSESSGDVGVVNREVVEEKAGELVDEKKSEEIGEVKREAVEEKAEKLVDGKEKEAVAEEIRNDEFESKEVEVVKEEVQDSGKVENPQGAGVGVSSDAVQGDKKDVEKHDVAKSSSKPSDQEDEDLEWDEIEDLGELEEKKASDSNKSPVKVDLMKRLSAADEDDLSWDIEDDDEPTKS